MFSKGKPAANEPAAAPAERSSSRKASDVPSIISPDMTVTGNLSSAGDIQVDGRVDGDVDAANLTIGQNGTIEGTIQAHAVQVHGTVSGEIRASSVTLAATARIHGDIVHESLAIEAGAYLDGHCRRREAQVQAAKAQPGAAQSAAPAQDQSGARSKSGKRAGTASAQTGNGDGSAAPSEDAGGLTDSTAGTTESAPKRVQ